MADSDRPSGPNPDDFPTMFPLEEARTVGKLLANRYQIVDVLGIGGMGAVYKAFDRELGRIVALKTILPEYVSTPIALTRLKQEVLLAQSIVHRNVIRIFDIGEDGATKFITMAFIEGRTLKTLIDERGKLAAFEAAAIIHEVCEGLEAAHAAGVVHRDLKPNNIMIGNDGHVVVMDFGIARGRQLQGATQIGVVLGTPEYMSPEQVQILAFALTDRAYSLAGACNAFGVEHGKTKATEHGVITPEYIDYNRRDVLATSELAEKLLAQYETHPIALQVTKAFSTASMGKAYLRAMGITPILERQPDFPTARLGHAQSAFFGGRTSAHIRKTVVPVVYTDFLSMYPTVNALMGLWRFVTAERIHVIDNCAEDISAFLQRIKAGDLFQRDTWPALTAFVRVLPDDDVLPTRCQYAETHDWQIGLNYLRDTTGDERNAVWYALPDVVASVLLTGRVPRIVDAFRIVADGVAADLRPTKLAGRIAIDPATQDFFRAAIEERKRVTARTDWPEAERTRLEKALKVFANAASYGIYAEMHRQESNDEMDVQCHGVDPTPFTCRVAHPEVPGEYCFPPVASLITSAARLMLALLEHNVTTRGGTYAMEDTDSMAIVASEAGGLVACPGGSQRLPDGREAVKALSWSEVSEIVEQFSALNPYDPAAVPGSVLKVEGDNFDPDTKAQRQLYCYAISSKRYALFVLDQEGRPSLTKWSEHGLGHLCNPVDLDSDGRDWIRGVWLNIVRRAVGLRTKPLAFERRPAVGRITVSSPAVMRPLAGLNAGKPYDQQLKPFNFLLTCHVRALGHPSGVDAQRFHLIAPYESDPARWMEMDWLDQYSGDSYRITTEGHHGGRGVARVKTYGDVIEEYEWHPETKCADAAGKPCTKQTVGLLHRRRITLDHIVHIGRESNQLEEVEAGLVRAGDGVYVEYQDPRRDYWRERVIPALKALSLKSWQRDTGKSPAVLIDARSGRRRPQAKHCALLISYARRRGLLS